MNLCSNADLSDEGGASGGGASGGGASGDGGDGGGREGVAATSPVSRSVSTCRADRERPAPPVLLSGLDSGLAVESHCVNDLI